MRPWLTAKTCGDPNPHRPHKWDRLGDPFVDVVDPRFWCKGIENVPVKAEYLGEAPSRPVWRVDNVWLVD